MQLSVSAWPLTSSGKGAHPGKAREFDPEEAEVEATELYQLAVQGNLVCMRMLVAHVTRVKRVMNMVMIIVNIRCVGHTFLEWPRADAQDAADHSRDPNAMHMMVLLMMAMIPRVGHQRLELPLRMQMMVLTPINHAHRS